MLLVFAFVDHFIHVLKLYQLHAFISLTVSLQHIHLLYLIVDALILLIQLGSACKVGGCFSLTALLLGKAVDDERSLRRRLLLLHVQRGRRSHDGRSSAATGYHFIFLLSLEAIRAVQLLVHGAHLCLLHEVRVTSLVHLYGVRHRESRYWHATVASGTGAATQRVPAANTLALLCAGDLALVAFTVAFQALRVLAIAAAGVRIRRVYLGLKRIKLATQDFHDSVSPILRVLGTGHVAARVVLSAAAVSAAGRVVAKALTVALEAMALLAFAAFASRHCGLALGDPGEQLALCQRLLEHLVRLQLNLLVVEPLRILPLLRIQLLLLTD